MQNNKSSRRTMNMRGGKRVMGVADNRRRRVNRGRKGITKRIMKIVSILGRGMAIATSIVGIALAPMLISAAILFG